MKTQAFYTAIITHDIEKTKEFYVNLLGFHVAHNTKISAPDTAVVVLENEDGARLGNCGWPVGNKEREMCAREGSEWRFDRYYGAC